MYPASATLRDLVAGLSRFGAKPAVVAVAGGQTRELSFAELSERALRLASGLHAHGIAPGEPVAIFGPNSPDWVVVRLAIAALGALAVAVDEVSTDDELAVLIPDSGARLIFCSGAHVGRVRAAARGRDLDIVRLDGEQGPGHWSARMGGAAQTLPPISAQDDALLVYTSGTTGRPKGFTLTHANLLANINGLIAQGIVRESDRMLLPLPLHHVYPLTVGLLTTLALGCTVVLPEGVTGPLLLAALKAGRVSAIIGVPRLYAAIASGLEARVAARGALAHRAFRTMLALSIFASRHLGLRVGRVLFGGIHRQLGPELWLMASGGARFEADLIWKLKGLGWEVLSGYGLAETASILTCNRPDTLKVGGEGRALPGAELRVADPDAEGIGEIQARGPSVFKGYRNNPDANAAAFTGDGWFRTGDLGRIDGDGTVWITGRLKEMIVLGGGKNVFPEELEKLYAAHPAIKELAVLEDGGVLVALVVPDLDRIAQGGNLRVEDVIRVALTERAQLLPSFQRVAGYAIVREPLPRTRLGKYQRFLLPDIYRRAHRRDESAPPPASPADQALLADETAGRVWAWLSARYPDRRLHLDLSPQLDLGVDSLEWVTMTLELAERFGIRLSEEEDGADIRTLRDLVALAAKRAASPAGPAPSASPKLTADQLAWLEPRATLERAAGALLYGVNVALMKTAFRLRVEGRHHVPAHAQIVIVCNHASDLDPLVVAAALPLSRLSTLRWGGDAVRIFGARIGRWLARAARIFPVDERTPATTLAIAAEALVRGDSLVWFPESWRSPTGELQRFLPGVGRLAAGRDVLLVPARISGAFEAMPRTSRLPRLAPVQIVFGPPLTAAEAAARGEGATQAERIAAGLRAAVAALPFGQA